MKTMIGVWLIACVACVALAQQAAKPPLRRGIHVEMASASHAVAMPAADEKDATVVGITADGKVFVGDKAVEVSALSTLKPGTVFVKADARTPYQKVLAVLDALDGRAVVLLTQPTAKPQGNKPVPPDGLKLVVGGR